MRLLISTGLLVAVIACRPPETDETTQIKTVAGDFSGKCQPSEPDVFGHYVYRLGTKVLQSLGSECEPGDATSFVVFKKVWRSTDRTSVLALEGVTASTQQVRLIHFQAEQPPLMVDLYGEDPEAVKQLGVSRFSLILPGHGFQTSGDYLSRWKCRYEVDFSTRRVSSGLVRPSEEGVDPDVCDAEVVVLN